MHRGFMVTALVLLTTFGCSETPSSPSSPAAVPVPTLTARKLAPRSEGGFRFLVAGHIYGRPVPGAPRPAATFVDAIPSLNRLEPAFVALLGDCFYLFSDTEVAATVGVLGRLEAPVLNAVGNHDVAKRERYAERFGSTWFAFSRGRCRFVFLDTELDPWRISGEQLDFLRAEITAAEAADEIRSVFFFGHKVLFGLERRRAAAAMFANDPKGLLAYFLREGAGPTYVKDISPHLARLAKKKAVHWFAGDVGAHGEKLVDLFWDKDPESGIVYVATGIGDRPDDLIVQVDVDADGRATLSVVSLTGQEMLRRLEGFGVEYWNRRFMPTGLPKKAEPYFK